MNNKEMETFIKGIQEKIGKDASGLISDDLGMLITDNSKMNKDLTNKENEINKLKDQKEKLIATNGNLLQQISMGEEENFFIKNKKEKKEKPKKFNFKDAFDTKGHFK